MNDRYRLSTQLAYFLEEVSKRNITDYTINPEKVENMKKLIAYCTELAGSCTCSISRTMTSPRYLHGYIEIGFNHGWSLQGERLNALTKTLTFCDGFNIESDPINEDGVQVTFFINDLWIHREST